MKITKLLLFVMGMVGLSASGENPTSFLRDSLPDKWQMTPQSSQTLPTEDNWWHIFHDPVLNKLISKAVANNFNLDAAVKRIEMARKQIQTAEAGYFPSITVAGSWNKGQTSGALVHPSVSSSRSSFFSLGASMNWELDVFGRVKAAAKEKKMAYNASRADYDAVMVSLCANVATSYMELRMNQKLLEVAEAHIKSQLSVLKIVEARFEAELSDKLDLTQSKIVLYNTQSSIPTLRAKIRTLVNAIFTMIGEYPDETNISILKPSPMPEFNQTVNIGIPSDLIRRRPDIVEAEMTLGQYAAAVGIAKKDFLPTLSLTGSVATEARQAGDLFGSHSLSYNISPQLSWTLFDGLARNYRTAEAKLQMEAAIDTYNYTVMNAVEEVNNAIIQYKAALESINLQQNVVSESEESLRLAVDLYKTGLTAFSNVVDGQMNWLESQSTLVTYEGNALTALINIYQALGGGF